MIKTRHQYPFLAIITLLGTIHVLHAYCVMPSSSHHSSLCAAAHHSAAYPRFSILYAKQDDDDDDDDDDIGQDDKEDWRAFRAKLVMSESSAPSASTASSTSSTTPSSTAIEAEDDLDGIGALFASDETTSVATSFSSLSSTSAQWAYDSGNVIERGAVILGGVEQSFGFGLRQQYFHKAVLLVLDHDEARYTKGIILNRPTHWTLEDADGRSWPVWFGGDVSGLDSPNPDICCLHSIKNSKAQKASTPIVQDMYWTSWTNAQQLVQQGIAKIQDFWTFVGCAGWGPGQLRGELDRQSWYMIATDSQTLLQELQRLGQTDEPRAAGLDTWNLLMEMIQKRETAQQHTGGFDDHMLKEWAYRRLVLDAAKAKGKIGGGALKVLPLLIDKFKERLLDDDSSNTLQGKIICASSDPRSPFLLDQQEFHKSLVLILSDNPDENVSVGCILNRPATKGVDIKITDRLTGKEQKVTLPMRFGGPYAVEGQDALVWLYNQRAIPECTYGTPLVADENDSSSSSSICKISPEDAVRAILKKWATPQDFVVVSGVSIWPRKTEEDLHQAVKEGKWTIMDDKARIDGAWETILQQTDVVTKENLKESLKVSNDAWEKASLATKRQKSDSKVFDTQVDVSDLSDEALESWVSTFMLGDFLQ